MQTFALFPPYFDIGAETSFDEAWEVFCCDMLNLHEAVAEIRRRKPPEQGVDLIWEGGGRAYQCKSTDTGKAGDINITKTTASLQDALRTQKDLKWTTFGLCTNADLTGTQETAIKAVMPKILLYTPAFWRTVCEKHWNMAARRFRTFISLSPEQTLALVGRACVKERVATLLETIKTKDTYGILVYSNRRREVFELQVASEFTVDDVLNVLIEAFQLPNSYTFAEERMSVSIEYTLRVSEKAVALGKTLGDLGVGRGAVVTFWKTFVYTDHAGRSTEANVMELARFDSGGTDTTAGRRHNALGKFGRLVDDAWEKALTTLTSAATSYAVTTDPKDASSE